MTCLSVSQPPFSQISLSSVSRWWFGNHLPGEGGFELAGDTESGDLTEVAGCVLEHFRSDDLFMAELGGRGFELAGDTESGDLTEVAGCVFSPSA